MMKILYYQCFSGIKGEMNLAAMLSLGVDLSYVIKQLNLLKLNHTYQIKHHEERRKGIKGIKIDVQINSDLQSNSNYIIHANRHECFHDKNDANDIGDFNGKYNAISGEKCTLSEIQRIITASGLSPKVQSKSLHAFTKWAEAEATVRGITKEHVYLHEMDAIKAIIHIVGAAICLEYLKVDKVCASRVELGGGFVQSEQGLSPVPRPVVSTLSLIHIRRRRWRVA